jgi:hypothetical protein
MRRQRKRFAMRRRRHRRQPTPPMSDRELQLALIDALGRLRDTLQGLLVALKQQQGPRGQVIKGPWGL